MTQKKVQIRNITPEEIKNSRGTCYKRAFNYLADLPEIQKKQARLVHGTVVGIAGSLRNIRFGHAWVEIGERAYDIGYRKKKPLISNKYIYYKSHSVTTVKKYTNTQMYKIGLANGGNYGPWKAILSTKDAQQRD